MKRSILLLSVACLLAGVGAAFGQTAAVADTPANRLAAAKRYLLAVPPAEMVGETLERAATQVPELHREEFKKAMQKVASSERIEALTLQAVTKHFTVKEINALATFYSSPEGRSIGKKFPEYMADVMPSIQAELNDALDEFFKDIH